jgi:resuscitation-promoting factor RpfB
LPCRPQRIAWSLLATFHWAHRQFRYLERLWNRESGWNRFACNPYSGAYGIPQALPASKMASAGPAYRTNARTQILWGMGYIRGTYVTPYRAWLHEMHYGWY